MIAVQDVPQVGVDDLLPHPVRPVVAGDNARLLLPDELLMLIRHSRSRNPPTSDTMRAAVVASVLAELRLRGRLTVARDRTGLVGVRSQEPTGEPFLDGVLVRIAARYYLAPGALASEFGNVTRWRLRARYYAGVGGGPGHVRLVPLDADLLAAP